MLKIVTRLILIWLITLFSMTATADEIRPGYLELKEISKNIFSVIFKVPAKQDKRLSLEAQLPTDCKNISPITSQFINGAYLQHWTIQCESDLAGKTIVIEGLELSSTDVLLRMEFIDTTSQSTLLSSTTNSYQITEVASSYQIISTYTLLGIGHILLGVDHLLFVFALLLIVKNKRYLLYTVTAFTVAHSITLAGATLGFVNVPQPPVEAIIALSILFLAMEIIREKQGKSGVTSRWPWIVACIFGLLHGFGFAGALSEVGLPQQAIPLALVFFNVGVELGQLLFITIVLCFGLAIKKLKQPRLSSWSETIVVYSIGGVSSFWLFERISVF